MEGCQHNTMDVEYFGPNPQMGLWYLGALRAAEEMARHVGEADFARECRRLFESGSRWVDAHLLNGEYYEHRVVPPASAADVAPGPPRRHGRRRRDEARLPARGRVPRGPARRPVRGRRLRPRPPRRPRARPRRAAQHPALQPAPGALVALQQHAGLRGGRRVGARHGRLPEGPPGAALPLLRRGDDRLRVRGRGGDALRGDGGGGPARDPGRPRALRRRAAEPLRRGRVRPPLRARDGELGGRPRPHRLPVVRGHGHARARAARRAGTSGRTARPGVPSSSRRTAPRPSAFA